MMSGPSPYNALLEIFGSGWPAKDEDNQQHIKKIAKKCNKVHNEKVHKCNNKKPSKIDNACQTQPLRDYSYNKVIEPSKLKANKKHHEKCDNLKKHCNDNAKFSSNIKVHKKRTSSAVGVHLKQSHVCALYKTVSDIEKIFREERNLHLHSKKCLCSSCGALGVITESMKHPVDYSDGSSESDDDDDNDDNFDDDDVDDDDDDDYDEEYYNALPRYNSTKKTWKIEYKDSESIRYGFPNAEGYLRLIVELEKMIKRVRSLERLAIRNNIPIRRNKVDLAFGMQAKRINGISKKPNQHLISTSSSEIDKKQCGLFSIPNIIKRRFSKKKCSGVKQETMNDVKKAPTKLRSKNYKNKTNDTPTQNEKKNTYIEIDKKYQSNCLDEKIQNFDLALLNENEVCELMFHLKNKDLNNVNRMKQSTIVPSNIPENNRGFLNRKPEIQNPKPKQIYTPNHTMFKMGTSPVGLRTISEKASQRTLRNDATFIRKSPNYLENNIETNRNTRNLFDDFLNINNVTTAEQHNEINSQRHQKVLYRDSNISEESANCYNVNKVDKPRNDTVHKLNLDITKREQTSEKDSMKNSRDSLLHKPLIFSKKDWINEMINKSIGVIEEKYSHEIKMPDNAIKAKIGKTVTYSKQNEYCYFKDSLMDIKPVSKTYCSTEIGESSGLCKQMRHVEQIESSDSDLSKECRTYHTKDNISRANRNIGEIFLPFIKKSSQLQTGIIDNKNKHSMYDVSDEPKSSLIIEDLYNKEFKIAKIPINNNNQFKYEPETHTHSLRSELRSQNENTTCKASIEPDKKHHDERLAEFISKNIFEKPPRKEKSTDSIITDTQNSCKKINGELKFLHKSENNIITENENSHKKYSEEAKNIQKCKFVVENKSSRVKANAETQTCEVNKNIVKNKIYKRKEYKETQITDMNDERDNKLFFKKDNVETKRIRKAENKNTSPYENFNKKAKENIQKNAVDNKNSIKRKENRGIQVTDIQDGKENIIEEIHECPLSFNFNNYPPFSGKNINSQVIKKSILKTYRRAINESPLKIDKKNSVVINKFKKHVNLNIVQKISSSMIQDIFNRKTDHNAAFTKVFKRTKHTIKKEENRMTYSKIPRPISHQIKKDIVANITNNLKTVSRIPLYLNKANNKGNSELKPNLKIPKKKNFNQTHLSLSPHYNVVKNTPTSTLTKNNEICNSKDTILIGKTIYKNNATAKPVLTKNKFHSKIPVPTKNQQNEVCKKSIKSKPLSKSNLVTNGKKAAIYSSIITNNDLSSTFPQHINLYPAFTSVPSPSYTRNQEEINKPLPLDFDILNKHNSQIEKNKSKTDTDSTEEIKVASFISDLLNSYNSEIGKVEHKIDTDSKDEAKILAVGSDILNSYNSQIKRVERKTDSTDKAKVLPANSDILCSYNSQIDKVEHKIVTDSADDDKISTESTTIPNDITEENSNYITSPYAIDTYESSCTFSEGSSGAIFIYKSKCQLGTDKSIDDSEFNTRISESVYTSTSDLSPSKKNKKWKWFKTFGSKFKSFLSVHTPKSSSGDGFFNDDNTSYNVSNEICNGKHLKKKVNEDNVGKCCKLKLNNKPKASSLSITLTLKKKKNNSSILLN